MYSRFLITLLILSVPFTSVFGDIKLGKGLDLDTLVYFKTDQDRATEEYFSLGAKLELEYEIEDNWELQLKLDVGTDAIRVEDLWGKVKFDFWRLKFGLFENWLLVDDIFTSRENIVAEDNPVRNYIDDMGWYSPGAVGVKFYRNYKGKGVPISAYSHLNFQPSNTELQLDAGVLWAYNGERSFLGLMGAYYPFFIHEMWVGSDNSYTQNNNFLINAVIADFSENTPLQYKVELTLANNLIDPVGYVHYPGDGEPSWFFGSYAYAGFPVGKEKFVWTPGLTFSFIIYELDLPEADSIGVRLGNKFVWNDIVSLNVELGIGINTYYSPNLITELEPLWGITLQVHI